MSLRDRLVKIISSTPATVDEIIRQLQVYYSKSSIVKELKKLEREGKVEIDGGYVKLK